MNLSTTFTASAVRVLARAAEPFAAVATRRVPAPQMPCGTMRRSLVMPSRQRMGGWPLRRLGVQDRRWQNDGCRGLHPDGLRWRPRTATGVTSGASKKSQHPPGRRLERTGAYRPVTKRAMMTMVRTCITPCTPTTKKKLPITRLILATSGSGRRNWMQTHKLVGSR